MEIDNLEEKQSVIPTSDIFSSSATLVHLPVYNISSNSKTVLIPTSFVPFDSLSRNWKFHVNCSHLDDSNNNRAGRISVKSAVVHGHERVNSKEDRSLDGFKGYIDERYFPGKLAKPRAAFKHFNTGS